MWLCEQEGVQGWQLSPTGRFEFGGGAALLWEGQGSVLGDGGGLSYRGLQLAGNDSGVLPK